MARRIRSAQLESRSARLKLPIRRKPYTQVIGRGLRIGYRRTKVDGSWSIIKADGGGGAWIKKIDGVVADDYRDADGAGVLDYWQAVKRVREIALGGDETVETTDKPVTIDKAIDDYAADLKARNGGPANATSLRHRMPATLRSKVLALVKVRDFREWRNDLVETGELELSSINRLMKSAKAAFNHAAALDERIANKDAWTTGLKSLKEDDDQARNVVISETEIHAIVGACYDISLELGLFVEVGACTGARPVQLARLKCQDLQADHRLMMPPSKKGRSNKNMVWKSIPIPASLAAKLADVAKGRPADAPLLMMPAGTAWYTGGHKNWFRDAVTAAGLDPRVVTYYALRHSRVTSMLLRGVPVSLVADVCDTSVLMIRKHYAANIADHGETLLRANMLDLAGPTVDNVVPLTRTTVTSVTRLRRSEEAVAKCGSTTTAQ
jgi:integrase